MTRCLLWALALCLVGCGGSASPSGPSAPPVFAGAVTDTVSGAPVVGFTATLSGSRLIVSAPGYVARDTRAGASTVDLIPEAGFDLAFYRQFARGAMDGALHPLRVLRLAPRVYVQTTGLSAANVAALEQAARDVVPALTGGRFQVAGWDTGNAARPPSSDWITAELIEDAGAVCGSATGMRLRLNTAAKCHYLGHRVDPSVLGHEIGHALGFYHVPTDGALMSNTRHEWGRVVVADIERRHAAIAYARSEGNLDVDVDP